ncbi:MAG: class I SAM-dependent methyltransferase [Myxococcales bacterium]|nr:class I SAM-dependent methyltransferase [Myxococcales bacterium]
MALTFIATSRKRGLSHRDLTTIAAWLGLRPHDERPLPADEAGLVLTTEGVRLHVPGEGGGWWPAGLTAQRTDRGLDDPLVRAVQPAAGLRVLDATLGLGHDALVLARHGAHVLGLEHQAPLLYYAAEGLRRHDAAASRRLAFRRADHRRYLAQAATAAFDVVCLDPMFPDPDAPAAPPSACCGGRPCATPSTLAPSPRPAGSPASASSCDSPPARSPPSSRARHRPWSRPRAASGWPSGPPTEPAGGWHSPAPSADVCRNRAIFPWRCAHRKKVERAR